eukprot:gnl/MRDRNA2_/MRDRNA2_70147_c0_seq1.p1 gnl/MRDRNA2_/MRDRNA2_70147_c0~~gnl/MRDRNA2_/MRDRNA2_70147_c0_seq1.p1  ORF type:complete len:580 (-),score=118.82 gnl/MRDRNA2_/MRDRNA2_70147_c0_seq1:52-1791(-)
MSASSDYQDLACIKCEARNPGYMNICWNVSAQMSRRDAFGRDGFTALCPAHADLVGMSLAYARSVVAAASPSGNGGETLAAGYPAHEAIRPTQPQNPAPLNIEEDAVVVQWQPDMEDRLQQFLKRQKQPKGEKHQQQQLDLPAEPESKSHVQPQGHIQQQHLRPQTSQYPRQQDEQHSQGRTQQPLQPQLPQQTRLQQEQQGHIHVEVQGIQISHPPDRSNSVSSGIHASVASSQTGNATVDEDVVVIQWQPDMEDRLQKFLKKKQQKQERSPLEEPISSRSGQQKAESAQELGEDSCQSNASEGNQSLPSESQPDRREVLHDAHIPDPFRWHESQQLHLAFWHLYWDTPEAHQNHHSNYPMQLQQKQNDILNLMQFQVRQWEARNVHCLKQHVLQQCDLEEQSAVFADDLIDFMSVQGEMFEKENQEMKDELTAFGTQFNAEQDEHEKEQRAEFEKFESNLEMERQSWTAMRMRLNVATQSVRQAKSELEAELRTNQTLESEVAQEPKAPPSNVAQVSKPDQSLLLSQLERYQILNAEVMDLRRQRESWERERHELSESLKLGAAIGACLDMGLYNDK